MNIPIMPVPSVTAIYYNIIDKTFMYIYYESNALHKYLYVTCTIYRYADECERNENKYRKRQNFLNCTWNETLSSRTVKK